MHDTILSMGCSLIDSREAHHHTHVYRAGSVNMQRGHNQVFMCGLMNNIQQFIILYKCFAAAHTRADRRTYYNIRSLHGMHAYSLQAFTMFFFDSCEYRFFLYAQLVNFEICDAHNSTSLFGRQSDNSRQKAPPNVNSKTNDSANTDTNI